MDLKTCDCGEKASYSEKFDAYFCEKCNKWLEDICGDYECNFCNARPESPNDVNETEL